MVVLGWAAFMVWFGCNLKFQNTELLKDGGKFHSKDILSLSIVDTPPNDTNTTVKLLKVLGEIIPHTSFDKTLLLILNCRSSMAPSFLIGLGYGVQRVLSYPSTTNLFPRLATEGSYTRYHVW